MNGDPKAIRILLVDDHHALADLLARYLEQVPDFRVVATAYSVADARQAVRERVDVALMDYLLPDGTGADATRAVKTRWPAAHVVMLTAADDDETILDSIQAGADGFLSKTAALDEVVAAVRAAHAGETILEPSVIAKIAERVATIREKNVERRQIEPLTSRELEVLRALCEGLSTNAICARMSITPNTLRTHVQNVSTKLHVHSKLEAVAFAFRYGLVEQPSASDRLY